MKHLYSRQLVDLSLELHIEPSYIHRQMMRLRHIDDKRLRKLWDKYAHKPKKLARMVNTLRSMRGFGMGNVFYAGVEVNVSWEATFQPLDAEPRLTPLMLVIILDLYFRLTPNTMVEDTPEVTELARLLGIGPSLVVDVLRSFLCCDPYLNYVPEMDNKLVGPCSRIWNEYAILEPQELEGLAEQMKYYFK
ncbi:MAG: hypothetical protein ACOCOA_00720 [Prevotella sp.]